MTQGRVFAISLRLVLAFAFARNPAVSQQKSLRQQLVGTWSLISFELTQPDGSKNYLFGMHPKGVHTFAADGHFALIVMRPDLPKVASGDQTKLTAEEAQAISTGSISYFGTYTVDELDKALTLRIEGSTLVNLYGIEQKRIVVSISANEMKLRNPAAVGGGHIDLVLRRAK